MVGGVWVGVGGGGGGELSVVDMASGTQDRAIISL